MEMFQITISFFFKSVIYLKLFFTEDPPYVCSISFLKAVFESPKYTPLIWTPLLLHTMSVMVSCTQATSFYSWNQFLFLYKWCKLLLLLFFFFLFGGNAFWPSVICSERRSWKQYSWMSNLSITQSLVILCERSMILMSPKVPVELFKRRMSGTWEGPEEVRNLSHTLLVHRDLFRFSSFLSLKNIV